MAGECMTVSNCGDDTLENVITTSDDSEQTRESEMVQLVSSSSFKTSNRVSSFSSALQELEGDCKNLLDLYADFESKQKQLESLKQEFSTVLHELGAIECKISDHDAGKRGFSEELTKTMKDAVLHLEIVQIQRLIAENGLLRTKLGLSERSRRDFRMKVESKLEEEMKHKIELEIELNCVKKKLEETLASNEELNSKVEKYKSKSREARNSLSDTITHMKSSISGHMDVETRKNSNYSLNESLLAYWELI